MTRLPVAFAAAVLTATALVSAANPKFTSVWKSPDAYQVNFAGKKLAALLLRHSAVLWVDLGDGKGERRTDRERPV